MVTVEFKVLLGMLVNDIAILYYNLTREAQC
jgi:hypothetical protein